MAVRHRRRRMIARLPNVFWAPLAASALILLTGAIGLLFGQPWLFPSLGPTAMLIAYHPDNKTSSLYNTLIGQLLGIAAGYLAIWLIGVHGSGGMRGIDLLTARHVWASVIGTFLVVFLQIPFTATHTPAVATTLLITLGGFRSTIHDLLALVVGVTIVALAGQVLREIRMSGRSGDRG